MLTAQARRIGYGCHRVYRLRPDGLMACEDTRENKIVAATRDIDSDSWVRTTTLLTILIFPWTCKTQLTVWKDSKLIAWFNVGVSGT